MFRRFSILFACFTSAFGGLGIGGSHLHGFHAGHLGRIGHSHLGGAKLGHIGNLHYGHIGGISGGHLLGSANPNSDNFGLDTPQQFYYDTDSVGSPLQTNPQYMTTDHNSPAWAPTQYAPDNVMLAHITSPKVMEVFSTQQQPIHTAHMLQPDNNPYHINTQQTDVSQNSMGIVGSPEPYINEPISTTYMHGPSLNMNEVLPPPNHQVIMSPSSRMAAMRNAATSQSITNQSPDLQMQLWHSPINEQVRSSIDSAHPEFERFHPGNLYGVPSMPYGYSHRGLLVNEFSPLMQPHRGYGVLVHDPYGGHMHGHGHGHHFHGSHGHHGVYHQPMFGIVGSQQQSKINQPSSSSPSNAFSTNQNFMPYFVSSEYASPLQSQFRNSRCIFGRGGIVGASKSDSTLFVPLTSIPRNLDNENAIVGDASDSTQDTVGTKWTPLLNKPFLGRFYKRLFNDK